MPKKSKTKVEKELQNRQEKNVQAFFTLDAEKKLTFFDENFIQLFPFTPPVIGQNFVELLDESQGPLFATEFEKNLSGQTTSGLILRSANGNGGEPFLTICMSPYQQNGQPSGVIGGIRQVCEEDSEPDEAKFQYLTEALSIGVAITIDGKNYWINQALADIFGYRKEEMIGRGVDFVIAPDKVPELLERMKKRLAGQGVPNKYETVGRHKTGTQLYLCIKAKKITFERKAAILILAEDISERKRMERALRESEEKYKNLFESLQEAVLIFEDGEIIQCNEAGSQLFGCKKEQMKGKTICDISPVKQFNGKTSKEQAAKILNRVLDGKDQHFEWDHKRCNGTVFHAEDRFTPFMVQNKKYIFGVVHDVSARYLNEQQLKLSEARYRDIVERSLDGYYFIDCDGVVSFVNSSVLEITGLTREQVMGVNFSDLVPPDKQDYVQKLSASVMGGLSYSWEEIDFIRPDGERIWIAFNGRRVIQKGIVIGIEGFVRDITELKKNENKIRESEARYRALFDNIPYEVFGLDEKGIFREANQEFIQNWGDVISRLPKAIKNKELRSIIVDTLENVSRTLKPIKRNFDLTRDDVIKHYKLILCPILTAERGLIGFVGINMDVSELTVALREAKFMSARLLDIQEEERTRIASEIHDSLGQYLTALQLEISAAISSLRSNPTVSEKVMADAKQTITRAIIEAKDLCHVLRPHLLDDFGLVVAMKDYIKEFSQKWKIKIDFKADEIKGLLNQTSETALFRVLQEALTNILKHARATQCEVSLSQKENIIELLIHDNGIGFNKNLIYIRKRDRFGLVFMKERMEFLGGQFIIETRLEKGTTIKALLPIEE